MPFEIKLSQLQDSAAFEKAVNDQINALHAFNKTVGKPRPVAHPLVEGAIKRVQKPSGDLYVPDYIIIDDTPAPPPEPAPPPPPTLEEKKVYLVNVVRTAENEAKYKILPERKFRLAITKLNIALAVKEEDRSGEQREDIASYLLIQDAYRKFELIGSQAESDIDDLTEDNVDSWLPPTFG